MSVCACVNVSLNLINYLTVLYLIIIILIVLFTHGLQFLNFQLYLTNIFLLFNCKNYNLFTNI